MPVTSSKITSPVRALGNELVLVAGYFAPGASPVVNDAKSGVTVARNGGAGLYTLTLPGRGSVTYQSIHITLEDPGAGLLYSIEGTDASARTIDLRIENTGGTATDPLGAVNFLVVVKESTY